MKYISIGAVLNEGTEHILDVSHGGDKFHLTGEKARLWLNGRLGFAEVFSPLHLNLLDQLSKAWVLSALVVLATGGSVFFIRKKDLEKKALEEAKKKTAKPAKKKPTAKKKK